MSARTAFRCALVAAIAMIIVGALMGVSAPPCNPLPMSPMVAFELARSVDDLQRIFGMAGDACRAPLVAQLDHSNVIDAAAYIPAYTAFFVLVLYALSRRDRMIGWSGVAIALGCAVADWAENGGMFNLSAAPDVESGWLGVLIVATNAKWIGLGVVTTLGGVMVMRRGGLGWIVLIPCVVPLAASLWAVVMPDDAGPWLLPGMVIASVALLVVALFGAFAKDEAGLTRAGEPA